MKTRQRGLVASILMATLVISPLVDAKRAGGGKSQGMQRSVAPSQSQQQQRYATPNNQYQQQQRGPQTAPGATAATAAQQKSGSNVGRMVAAGAAGVAVGAIAANALADDKTSSNQGHATSSQPIQSSQSKAEEKSSGIPGWIWIILIAGIAFFIFRKMSAKKKLDNNSSASSNGGGTPNNSSPFQNTNQNQSGTNIFGQNVGGSGSNYNAPSQAPFGNQAQQEQTQLPDGTESAAFLRIARQRFNHIQSMNTASNIEEIRRYLTPELYNSMYQDIMANRDQDVAEFENLNASVAGSTTENNQYVVSVRFTGSVSEDLNSTPQPFTEVWHFVKPVQSQQDWLVAGIQVEN